MKFDPAIYRSAARKNVTLLIDEETERLSVYAPALMTDEEIEKIIEKKSDWIKKKLKEVKEANSPKKSPKPFKDWEIASMKSRIEEFFKRKADRYSNMYGIPYKSLRITNNISNYGSCKRDGSITINAVAALMPDTVIDYIIIHELCHIKHMNHSPAFWREVERFCPYHKAARKYLREDGAFLIRRLKRSKKAGTELPKGMLGCDGKLIEKQ